MFSTEQKKELLQFVTHVFTGYIDEYSYYIHRERQHRESLERLQEHVSNLYNDVTFYAKRGASKHTFIFSNFDDVVVKIPFKGTAYISDENEIEVDSIFEFASDSYEGWNYCETDISVYNDMLADAPELADFFCKVEFLCEVDGHPIYIQEKADMLADDIYDQDYKSHYPTSEKSLQECISGSLSDSIYEGFYENDVIPLLIARVCDEYGEEIAASLTDYCARNIYDLHELNYGVDKNGIIKIFDYSGYND